MAKAAKKAKLDKDGLKALGLARLTEIVLDEAALNPSFKKRLNVALAGIDGADAVAKLIDKRLAMLEKSRSHIGWQKEKTFGNDLDSICASIVKEFGVVDPAMALERLIRFVLGYDEVAERVNDSSGRIAGIYGQACDAAARLAQPLPADRQATIPALITPRLGGIDYHGLKTLLAVRLAAVLSADVLKAWDDTLASAMVVPAEAAFLPAIVSVRRAIADARGDIDTYVAIEESLPEALQEPAVVAERLFSAGRHAEALLWVRKPRKSRIGFMRRIDVVNGEIKALPNREKLEAAILDALKDRPASQALRWKAFEQRLDAEMLREYIVKAGDFEEFEALDKAFAFVDRHKNRYSALLFYIAWPHLERASRYVLAHSDGWDGQFYDVLVPAAETLEETYPVAATVLYRALLDRIIGRGISQAYHHGASYLMSLADLACRPGGNEGLMSHADYLTGLQKAHGRKYGFWEYIPPEFRS